MAIGQPLRGPLEQPGAGQRRADRRRAVANLPCRERRRSRACQPVAATAPNLSEISDLDGSRAGSLAARARARRRRRQRDLANAVQAHARLRRHAAGDRHRADRSRRTRRGCGSAPPTRSRRSSRGDVELRRSGSRAWRSVPTQVTAAGLKRSSTTSGSRAGDYDVRARAWNAAGLERSTENWTTGQPAELTLPLRIADARPARRGPQTRRQAARRAAGACAPPVLAYGRRVRLTGQLTAPGGNPLVDVPVQVSTRIDGPNTAWRPGRRTAHRPHRALPLHRRARPQPADPVPLPGHTDDPLDHAHRAGSRARLQQHHRQPPQRRQRRRRPLPRQDPRRPPAGPQARRAAVLRARRSGARSTARAPTAAAAGATPTASTAAAAPFAGAFAL